MNESLIPFEEKLQDIVLGGGHELVTTEKVALVETKMLDLPQVSCPVKHIFGAGIYIREVSIPAGVFSIGHFQKTTHMNHMVKGHVIVLNADGTTSELRAPVTFVGTPGRKIGFILEDMVWHNIYPTDETDIETLEEMFLDKSEGWGEHDKRNASVEYLMRHSDRVDFEDMLKELNVTSEVVLSQSEEESDQIPLPAGNYKMMVSDSYIEGKGIFVTSEVLIGEVIAPARITGKRTPAGRYTNHSPTPNAEMVLLDNGDINLVAIKGIEGCYGGESGEEVTVDYRQVIMDTNKMGDVCQA